MAKLPSFEAWKAPWEERGEEFNAETAKRYVYNVLTDREKAETKAIETAAERDQLKAKVDEYETKDLSEVEKLRRELEEAKAKPAEDAETKLENARLKLALEHGLTVKQAERLRGSTPDELEADVAELKALLGESKKGNDEGDRGNPFGPRLRTGNDDGSDEFTLADAEKLFT